ncbi:MAG: ABC transporter substrate-binding protein [Nocardioides sp.]|uniref:ABC transporter substrate-binding protein n=1 Tax=Nocardioides sp. TaxID=35761 RepID=UPI003F110D49
MHARPRFRSAKRPLALGSSLLIASLALTACGGEEESAHDAGEGILSAACPETVVFQSDWEPEAEHGGMFQLLGDEYTIDADAKLVSGPLMSGGEKTGVTIEIRNGGATVGYQSAQSMLYQDRDILLGYGRIGDQVVAQADTPVTAVMATMNKSPYAIYWDPETYPDVKGIADLKEAGATVNVGSLPETWIDYLVGEGVLDEKQLDRSDAPKPATFVAAKGKLAEAGFITAEPFMYEHEIAEWGRPVAGQMVADAGYPEYFQAISVREADVEAQADCLEKLVPVLQQAHVDYANDPSATNDLIIELVEEYDTGWVYTLEGGEYAHQKALDLGIVANGVDGAIGSFEAERVQTLIDIVDEYTEADMEGVTPESVMTNEFIDPEIGLD